MEGRKGYDKELDRYFEAMETVFGSFLKSVEERLGKIPPNLKANILSGALLIELTKQIVIIKDSGFGIEAAGIKKVLLDLIKELDKTMVPKEDMFFVEKICQKD